jgi:tetratricopeptide (TPR) repeat protein
VGLLAGVLAVVAILAVLSGSRKVKAVSLAVVLLVVVAAGSLIILRDNPIVKNSRYLNRFSDISWSSGTMGTRLLTWSSGWKGFLDKPILGNGMENFIYAFSRYYRPEHFGGYGSETWFDRAHNAHLDVLVESGVVGAIGYAALWGMSAWFLLKQAYKKREELVQYALLFGALTAYMVQSFTIFNTYTGYITMFLFLAYVNYLQYSETKGPDEAKEVKEDINERSLTRKQIKKMKREGHLREESRTYGQPNYVVLGVIGVLVILGIVFIDVPSVYQNYYAGQAQAAAQSGRLELAAPLFKKAFANNSPIGETEIAEYLAKFSVERAAAKDMDQKATEEALRFAIETEERVHEKHPVDVKVMLILGRMYNMYGEFAKNPEDYYKKAVAVIKKAMEYSPTREQLYFELGQSYVLLHDVEGGVAVYRKGLELTPTVGVSNYYYGMSVFNWYKKLKADGDAAAAAEKLDEAVEYMDKAIKYGHFNQAAEGDLRRMSVVYGEAKQYNKLAEVFNQILKKNPKNKDIISQLAMTYKEMGDKEKARETAERLRKLDPTENELQQLEGFLQSLQ